MQPLETLAGLQDEGLARRGPQNLQDSGDPQTQIDSDRARISEYLQTQLERAVRVTEDHEASGKGKGKGQPKAKAKGKAKSFANRADWGTFCKNCLDCPNKDTCGKLHVAKEEALWHIKQWKAFEKSSSAAE